MIKYYLVQFAKSGVDWAEVKKYVEEAVEYARCNLLTRYGVKISWVSTRVGCYIKVEMPSDANFSNPGCRLSGISRHLLKEHKDIFEKYKVGTRLLWFVETPSNFSPLLEEKTILALIRGGN